MSIVPSVFTCSFLTTVCSENSDKKRCTSASIHLRKVWTLFGRPANFWKTLRSRQNEFECNLTWAYVLTLLNHFVQLIIYLIEFSNMVSPDQFCLCTRQQWLRYEWPPYLIANVKWTFKKRPWHPVEVQCVTHFANEITILNSEALYSIYNAQPISRCTSRGPHTLRKRSNELLTRSEDIFFSGYVFFSAFYRIMRVAVT